VAGDGDSTIKIASLKTMQIIETIPTAARARQRADLRSKDRIVIIGNQVEEVPYATMVSDQEGP